MHWSSLKRVVALGGTAMLAVPLIGAGVAQANGPSRTVYVARKASRSSSGTSCATAQYSKINAGIKAAAPGATVVVCHGTYKEDAVVDKPITLRGAGSSVVIDATGQPEVIPGAGGNGVTVLAPGASVIGLAVVNASGDGILVAGVDHANIVGNRSSNNAGFGIDINSSSWSRATGNTTNGNDAGGLNLANDLGVPASHNTLASNRAVGNKFGCGIVLADHTAAGVFANTIRDNVVNDNGLLGGGAGIVLASPVPGGSVRDNLVTGNLAKGNGLSGVTVHSHEPGQDFNGNKIVKNVLGKNNLLGDDPGIDSPSDTPDPQTTGVLVATVDPMSITVAHNVISNDHFGVWTLGPVNVSGVNQNTFVHVTVPFAAV